MTRVLAELLGAKQPDFQFGIRQLEQASGGAGRDIRLTSELAAASREKLRQLGLDPSNSTGQEVYQALAGKMVDSDKQLQRALKLEPLEPNFLSDLAGAVSRRYPRDCFALKSSTARRLFRQHPPKHAMKELGYRSLSSFLKNESVAGLFAAAKICESQVWWANFRKQYNKLTSTDFETRPVVITALDKPRWHELADNYTRPRRNNLITFSEAGVVALLPMSGYPAGATMAIFLLSIAGVNDIKATSSYLRLHQVKTDFGKRLAEVASRSPELAGLLNDRRLSWRTVHDFLAGSASVPEPLGTTSLNLKLPADVLAAVAPSLEFWRGTAHLAYHDGASVVSLNPLDAAINYMNKFDFNNRIAHHFRNNLWQKFWQSYLQAEILGERLREQLQRELDGPEVAPEFVLDEIS